MYKELVFVCLIIFIILNSTTEAKEKGCIGRSSSGIRQSSSSINTSSNFEGSPSGMHSNGWFHGFFHNTPYRYTYRPTYLSSGQPSTIPYQERKEAETVDKDTGNEALGYAISRALNSDFYSIFNVAHSISKYPEKIKNKEFLPSLTTEGPVSTYDINDIIYPTYSICSTT